ncbi:MAG: sigma-70 family RNA polymerase sigma factor [Myxococcota bacterium]
MEDSDDALLSRWRQADAAAGTELFRRYFDRVRRFFHTKVDPRDVEELVQTTFAAVVEGRDRFRGDGEFGGYIFGVARHILYRHLRKRASPGREVDGSVSSVAALGMSPSSVVAQREHADLVQRALQRIPVQQQMLLELSYWEEMPNKELAVVLEVEPTTVRTRLFRARAALEAELRVLMAIAPGAELPFAPAAIAKGMHGSRKR